MNKYAELIDQIAPEIQVLGPFRGFVQKNGAAALLRFRAARIDLTAIDPGDAGAWFMPWYEASSRDLSDWWNPEARPVTLAQVVDRGTRSGGFAPAKVEAYIDQPDLLVDYAVGAADLGAASVAAPHKRQRLWWVADAERRSAERQRLDVAGTTRRGEGEAREQRLRDDASDGRPGGERLGDSPNERRGEARGHSPGPEKRPTGTDGRLEHASRDGREPRGTESIGGRATTRRGSGRVDDPAGDGARRGRAAEQGRDGADDGLPRPTGPWSDAELVWCVDEKWRRVESGVAPLAARVPGDLVRLRGYGNAINPYVAEQFVRAYMNALSGFWNA